MIGKKVLGNFKAHQEIQYRKLYEFVIELDKWVVMKLLISYLNSISADLPKGAPSS